MTTRPIAIRLHRVLALTRPTTMPLRAMKLTYSNISSRPFSDFGDSKPDAATDLATSTKNKPIKDEPEVDRSQFTVRIEVKMPDMGNGDGKVLKWYKEEGDLVKKDDVLCDIETPDFTFGMQTDDDCLAIMDEILIQAPSDKIKEDEVICTLLHEKPKKKKTKEGAIASSD
ncbi:hypothetical protein MPSEU_000255100 [Mayamaea pseudoterrestris]|nr:hypothetical protein MPSEU_000255100 [Mayamaea pseudoterrestris]